MAHEIEKILMKEYKTFTKDSIMAYIEVCREEATRKAVEGLTGRIFKGEQEIELPIECKTLKQVVQEVYPAYVNVIDSIMLHNAIDDDPVKKSMKINGNIYKYVDIIEMFIDRKVDKKNFMNYKNARCVLTISAEDFLGCSLLGNFKSCYRPMGGYSGAPIAMLRDRCTIMAAEKLGNKIISRAWIYLLSTDPLMSTIDGYQILRTYGASESRLAEKFNKKVSELLGFDKAISVSKDEISIQGRKFSSNQWPNQGSIYNDPIYATILNVENKKTYYVIQKRHAFVINGGLGKSAHEGISYRKTQCDKCRKKVDEKELKFYKERVVCEACIDGQYITIDGAKYLAENMEILYTSYDGKTLIEDIGIFPEDYMQKQGFIENQYGYIKIITK